MPTPETPTGTAPAIVAALRGILITVVLGAITGLIAGLTGVDLSSIPPGWRPVAAALLIVAVRTLEGIVDQLRGQAPQAGPLGSAPATATAYIDTTGPVPNAGPTNAVDVAGMYATRDTEDLRTLLTLAAAELERRNAAPPASPATTA